MEAFKIIKFHVPISMYTLFTRSNRRDDLLITPYPSHNFLYKSSWLWNNYRQITGPKDFTTPIGSVKKSLSDSLIKAQHRYGDEWIDNNYLEFGV